MHTGSLKMSVRQFEAARLEIDKLGSVTDLYVHTIRKSELKKLVGLDQLNLNSLTIRWLSSPDLSVVPLPNCLVSLSLWHSSKLKSLKGVEQANNLKELYLRENGNPLDIAEVANLQKLEILIINGGYGNGQQLMDLSPLEGLPIEEITFINVKGEGLDFGPIARLPKLKKLMLPELLTPTEELAKVAAAHPWYFEQLMDLEQAEASFASRCKKCDALPHKLFLKGKKWLWCKNCQGDKIEEHLNAFRALVKNA